MVELRRHWEWADAVVASPVLRAAEAAAILSRGAPVRLLADLGPPFYGRWHGLTLAEIQQADPIAFDDWQNGGASFCFPRGESLASFRARVSSALDRLRRSGFASVLVVSHGEVIRRIVELQVDHALPPGRPWPGEMALLTRRGESSWALGRRSSDPEPLRSPLEREGLGGCGEPSRERHVAALEVRVG
jgi:broad specificity phosphatase PhoE